VHIDHEAEDFPYEQLAAIVRQRIQDGTYPPGSRIPTLMALEAQSGLSPMTVRRAVKLLAEQGWVRSKPGRGTFVAPADQWPQQ
jgi:GntR family transcriptional regulator